MSKRWLRPWTGSTNKPFSELHSHTAGFQVLVGLIRPIVIGFSTHVESRTLDGLGVDESVAIVQLVDIFLVSI